MGWVALVGAVIQGAASLNAGNAQAHLLKQNAKVAGWQADDVERVGYEDEMAVRRQANSIIGSQRAAAAGRGLSVNEGTALEFQVDTARLAEIEALKVRHNARTKAWAYRTTGDSLKYQAQLAKNQGQSDAAGTILAGYGNYKAGKPATPKKSPVSQTWDQKGYS